MAHVQKCPICGGKGQIQDETQLTTTCPSTKTCHGCGGKGWVEVQDNENAVYWPPIDYGNSTLRQGRQWI